MSKRCRICLCLRPRRHIAELEFTKNYIKHTYEEILLFSLDIKVNEDSKLGTKLCVKCHRKILDFYNFKTMAQKNNNNTSEKAENTQETEVFIDEVKIKCEVSDNEFHEEEPIFNIKTEDSNEKCDNNVQNEGLTDEVEIEFKEHFDDGVSLNGNIKEERENVPENTDNAQQPLLTPMVVLPNQKSKAKVTRQTCTKCGTTVNDLKRHMITHLPPEERQSLSNNCKSKSSGYCKECGKIVNRLQEHMVAHLPDDIWQKQKKGAGLAGTCKVCGKTVKRLKKHMVLHLPDYQRKMVKSNEQLKDKKKVPVKCLMCSREFAAQQYLDFHMKNIHLRPKKQCPVCDKKVNKLKMHMLTAHNRDQLRFECDWCGMKHATRYTLEKHIAIHTNDRPFHCNDCDKKFIQKSALLIHQRQSHLNIRPYLCQFCSRTFCAREALNIHVRAAHTKERPFKCTECGKGFNTKHMVKAHMDHVHTHVKNYVCTHCPKRYKTQLEVTRHYREAHLKIKNFQCRFCDSKFYRSSHMKRHEFNIHLRYAVAKTDD